MSKIFPIIAVVVLLGAAVIAGIYQLDGPGTDTANNKKSAGGINLEKWKEYSKNIETPEIVTTDPGIARATPGGELEKIARLEGLNNFTDGSEGSSGDNQSGAPREEAGYSEDADSDSMKAGASDEEVREVEEADLVKVIDDTLYVLNSYRGLLAVDISNPEDAHIVGQCSVIGYPVEMYVVDFLAVITVRTDYNFWHRYWGQEEISGDESGNVGTMIYIVNVGDPSHPAILKIVELEGFPVESRRVGHVIYQATNTYGWYWYNNEGKEETIVTSIDFGDPDTLGMKDQARFEGSSSQVHASPTAFYIAEPVWIYEEDVREEQFEKVNDSGEGVDEKKIEKNEEKSLWDYPFDDWYRYYTDISYLDIEDPDGDIVVRDSFRVPGQLHDKYQMDEYENTFRMVTHFRKGIGESRLYIVDISNPNNINALGTLLVDDAGSLMATRFAGKRAYTIHLPRAIDPLDVLDLSDPSNPKLCDVFEMPGWVTHMEVRGMKIIALGVDDSEGQRNIAVSLFDVSDPYNVVMEERVRLGGDYAYSAANWEPKALTVDEIHNVVIVPYTSWSKDYRNDNSGVQIVGFDLAEGDLWLGGNVSGPYSIERTRVVGDWILATSFKSLQVMDISDLKNPSLVKMIDLCVNVKDLVPVGEYVIQMVQDWYDGSVVLRSVVEPNDITAIDTLTLESNWARLFSINDELILAANVYEDEKMRGKLFRVSLNAGGDITATDLQGLPDGVTFNDRTNYYPWYGYYEDDIMIDRSRFSRSVYFPNSGEDRFALTGDSLIYYHIGEHPYSKWEYNKEYDQYIPTSEEKGSDELFVFNLSDLSRVPAPGSVKLETYSFVGFSVWDSTVYVQHRMTGVNVLNRSQYNKWNGDWYDYYYYEWYYKNHVVGIDCVDTAAPRLMEEYNIPGRMIGAGEDVIYTVSEWSDDRSNITLNTLTLYDDAAEITSAVNLGNGWVEVVMDGETAYVVDRPYNYYYYYGYRGSGNLEANTSFRVIDFSEPNVPVLQLSASLQGALNIEMVDQGHIVFHDSSLSSMMVYSTHGFPEMEFESMLLLQGYASTLRISNDVLYVPQGYYGAISTQL